MEVSENVPQVRRKRSKNAASEKGLLAIVELAQLIYFIFFIENVATRVLAPRGNRGKGGLVERLAQISDAIRPDLDEYGRPKRKESSKANISVSEVVNPMAPSQKNRRGRVHFSNKFVFLGPLTVPLQSKRIQYLRDLYLRHHNSLFPQEPNRYCRQFPILLGMPFQVLPVHVLGLTALYHQPMMLLAAIEPTLLQSSTRCFVLSQINHHQGWQGQ
jgi:hypothetical protein